MPEYFVAIRGAPDVNRAGVGENGVVAPLSISAVPVRYWGTVVTRPLASPEITRTIGIVTRNAQGLSTGAAAFPEAVKTVVKAEVKAALAGHLPPVTGVAGWLEGDFVKVAVFLALTVRLGCPKSAFGTAG